MKIGIVTQPLWGNYGGILQNFALQKVLMSIGQSPITLDYMRGYSHIEYIYIFFRRLIACLLRRKKSWIAPFKPVREIEIIDEFVNNYIVKTDPFWYKYQSNLIEDYGLDAIIVGSDQVWRPRYNTHIEDMFLKFCKSDNLKRVAYAASFGCSTNEYTKSQMKICSKLLKKFHGVSVRETSGVSILNEFGRYDAISVLDPTLLLGRSGFDEILPKDQIDQSAEKYLGAYILDNSSQIETMLKTKASKLGLNKIIRLEENTPYIGPIEWISTIKKASFFVTDSFHGTIFCLLYHIPFLTLINQNRGAERFHDLLNPLNLSKYLISDISEITQERPSINWGKIDYLIERQRSESLKFLTNSLK